MFKRMNEIFSKFSKLISLILFVAVIFQSVMICNLRKTVESFDWFYYLVKIGDLKIADKIICTENDFVLVESFYQQLKVFKGFSVDTLVQTLDLPGKIIDQNHYIDDSSSSIDNRTPFHLQLICKNKKGERFYLVFKGANNSLNFLHLEKIYESETKYSKIISLSTVEKSEEMLAVLQSENLVDIGVVNISSKNETHFRLPEKTLLKCGSYGIIGFDGKMIFKYGLNQEGFQVVKKNDTGEQTEIEDCRFPLIMSLLRDKPYLNMVYNGKTLFFIDQDTLVYTAYNDIEFEDAFDGMIVTKDKLYYRDSELENINVSWSKVLGSFNFLDFICVFLEENKDGYYQLCIYNRDKMKNKRIIKPKPVFHKLDIPIQAFLMANGDLYLRGALGAIFKMIEIEK